MKKLISNFADALLSKEQMKSVKGGYGVRSWNCLMSNGQGLYMYGTGHDVHTAVLLLCGVCRYNCTSHS